MASFWKDFKAFAMRGNVIDMAIGVIVGGAFGKIVNSLVSDIIMPILGVATGGIDFKDMHYQLTPAVVENGEVVQPANIIQYGAFIDTIINFLIIALCIFVAVRMIQKSHERIFGTPEEEAKKPTSEELLTDIRALLAKNIGEELPEAEKK